MSNRDEQKGQGSQQQGRQPRAEGEHGDKTHARLQEQLRSGAHEVPASERMEERHEQSAYEGKRRLVEDREQHDEAERNADYQARDDDGSRRRG